MPVKVVLIKKCINLVEIFFSYFLLPQLSFFLFFCFTFDTKPFTFRNFFNPHAFNVEPLNFTSFTFTHNKAVLVLTHFTFAPFILWLITDSWVCIYQQVLVKERCKIETWCCSKYAWISVSTRIVSRKVSFSVQTKKSQNLKPVTNNCLDLIIIGMVWHQLHFAFSIFM